MVRLKGNKKITTLWIFCEGDKTERNYFNSIRSDLRIRTLKIKVNPSENKDALGILDYAIKSISHKRDIIPGDLIYCVFDRDDNSEESLQKVCKKANDNGIFLIFSNPRFEFWILSHFELYKTPLNSDQLDNRVNQVIGGYRKNDSAIYDKTKDKIDDAIKNTKELCVMHKENNIELISRDSNPSSLVFELVEKIHSFSS